jgi:DNA-binding transcriptional ArsR family regulator
METAFLQIAALIGDPTRAAVLWALLDGRALTATELCAAADTTPSNMSMHLQKLVQAQLLQVSAQGRHRYYSFASKEVAYAIEALAQLVPKKPPPEKADTAIKHCRTCYDHLAGRIGVAIADSMQEQGLLINTDNTFILSPKGEKWCTDFGIDITHRRRTFLRACLDWSERRPHIAGAIGAALLKKMLEEDWVRPVQHSRAMVITGKGESELEKWFNINKKMSIFIDTY